MTPPGARQGGHGITLTRGFSKGKVWSNGKLQADAGSFTTRMDMSARDAMYYLIIYIGGWGSGLSCPGGTSLE
ncbi:hypothetical protein GCM10023074_58650 [Microbispora amethystogenes]|uniref:Uncharacterized protein n=1 Tax=Microbispora amethystogenes TaxID=1427754 RepID=A0ABQ4FIP4_9ACTN|nr:hypothetical protein Mam01_48600 [Microbispora amethystogenes]